MELNIELFYPKKMIYDWNIIFQIKKWKLTSRGFEMLEGYQLPRYLRSSSRSFIMSGSVGGWREDQVGTITIRRLPSAIHRRFCGSPRLTSTPEIGRLLWQEIFNRSGFPCTFKGYHYPQFIRLYMYNIYKNTCKTSIIKILLLSYKIDPITILIFCLFVQGK